MSSTELQENVPEHCPGVESETAGKSSACAGCPNQTICSSGAAKAPDPDVSLIRESMRTVRHKILVLSGKGGVGKSTVSSQLAITLALSEKQLRKMVISATAAAAAQDNNSSSSSSSNGHRNGSHHENGHQNNSVEDADDDDLVEDEDEELITQVGVLDIDLCGPSIPRMFGLEGKSLHQSNLGWTPVYYRDNLAVVSIGFMLPNADDAVIWRGPKKNGLIKQFLRDVYWGDQLDYLVVDTPPGTSDEHLSIVTYLKEAGIDGAVIVTTPQEIACQDVRKEINFCKKVGIPIIGVVENMSGFVCPTCHTRTEVFRSSSSGHSGSSSNSSGGVASGGEALATRFDIPFLGRIPLDPNVMQACETGASIIAQHPDSPASRALYQIVEKIKSIVAKK